MHLRMRLKFFYVYTRDNYDQRLSACLWKDHWSGFLKFATSIHLNDEVIGILDSDSQGQGLFNWLFVIILN